VILSYQPDPSSPHSPCLTSSSSTFLTFKPSNLATLKRVYTATPLLSHPYKCPLPQLLSFDILTNARGVWGGQHLTLTRVLDLTPLAATLTKIRGVGAYPVYENISDCGTRRHSAKDHRCHQQQSSGCDLATELLGKFFDLFQVGDQFLGQLALRHLVDLGRNSFRQLCKLLRGAF